MIDKSYGQLEIWCDQCDAHEMPLVGNDWQALMDWMRSNGWTKLKPSDGEWEHYCPRCSED